MSTIHICNQKSGVRKNTYLAGVTRGCLFGQQKANTEISALPQHRGSALMACRGATPCSLRSCKRRTNATSIRRSRLKEEDEERRTSLFFFTSNPVAEAALLPDTRERATMSGYNRRSGRLYHDVIRTGSCSPQKTTELSTGKLANVI